MNVHSRSESMCAHSRKVTTTKCAQDHRQCSRRGSVAAAVGKDAVKTRCSGGGHQGSSHSCPASNAVPVGNLLGESQQGLASTTALYFVKAVGDITPNPLLNSSGRRSHLGCLWQKTTLGASTHKAEAAAK